MPSPLPTERKRNVETIMESLRAVRKGFMAEHWHNESRITPSQWAVLMTLMNEEDMGVKELAKKLHITSSAATQLVDELVSKDYLIRTRSTLDGRAVTLGLTPSNKKKLLGLKAKRLKYFIRAFSYLNDAELAQYAHLNRKITQGIMQEQK